MQIDVQQLGAFLPIWLFQRLRCTKYIVLKDLHMCKVSARWVQRLLTLEKRGNRVEKSSDCNVVFDVNLLATVRRVVLETCTLCIVSSKITDVTQYGLLYCEII